MLASRTGSRQKEAKLKRISFGKSEPRAGARWRSANRETEAAGRVRIGRSGPGAFGGESVRKRATSLQRDSVATDITSWPKKHQKNRIRSWCGLSRGVNAEPGACPAPTLRNRGGCRSWPHRRDKGMPGSSHCCASGCAVSAFSIPLVYSAFAFPRRSHRRISRIFLRRSR